MVVLSTWQYRFFRISTTVGFVLCSACVICCLSGPSLATSALEGLLLSSLVVAIVVSWVIVVPAT